MAAEFRRRRLAVRPFRTAALAVFGASAGLFGFAVLFTESVVPGVPAQGLKFFSDLLVFGGFFVGAAASFLTPGRKRLSAGESLDSCASAAALGAAVALVAEWLAGFREQAPPVWGTLLWLLGCTYLWHLGSLAVRGPKARGEIFCNFLLLLGVTEIFPLFFRPFSQVPLSSWLWASPFLVIGGLLLWPIKRHFHAQKKEHLLVEQIAARGDLLQTEYHRPTPECPHPERWHMFDSLSAEVEVLDFLKALVIAVKPELVVETGTFSGLSTLRIAEGLAANGFGRIITCELDKKVYDAAVQRFAASGLASWIEARNESSLEMKVDGRIDLLFCDSEGPLREQEVRRFLPQVNPNGLILIHDASSSLKIVREAALRLEAEGLISVLLLPTPRGLVMAQKRSGRS